MNVLLSIKPKHAESILSGQKKYEFRKTVFRRKHINTVYVYATSPVKKIVGTFRIGDIIEDQPMILWSQLNEVSGLDEFEFFNYFKNNKIGFAIEIRDVKRFEAPLDPSEVIPDFVPPQSFCYMKFSLAPLEDEERLRNTMLQDYLF
jgi:predicted transcriptional regulator